MNLGGIEKIYITLFIILSALMLYLAFSISETHAITAELPFPTVLVESDLDEKGLEVGYSNDLIDIVEPTDSPIALVGKVVEIYLTEEEFREAAERAAKFNELEESEYTDEDYITLNAILAREILTVEQLRNGVDVEKDDSVFLVEELANDDTQLTLLDKDNLLPLEEK